MTRRLFFTADQERFRRLSGIEPFGGPHEQGLVRAGAGQVKARPAAVGGITAPSLSSFRRMAPAWARAISVPARASRRMISGGLFANDGEVLCAAAVAGLGLLPGARMARRRRAEEGRTPRGPAPIPGRARDDPALRGLPASAPSAAQGPRVHRLPRAALRRLRMGRAALGRDGAG